MLEEGQKNIRKRFFSRMFKVVGIFLSLFFCLLMITPVCAQQPLNTGIEFGAYTGLADADIRMVIAKIIRVALGLVGIVVLGFTVYGGYLYMTAGGNEEQTATAKRILKNMVIGLAIILASFAIVQFIINKLYDIYYQQSLGETVSGANSQDLLVGGLLGSVIESHYPMRNAVDIPRNTKIAVTFKQPLQENSVIAGGQINSDSIKIYPTSAGQTAALGLNPSSPDDDVLANITADKKTIVLRPRNYLGDGRTNVNYTVRLTNSVKLVNGQSAFSGVANYYAWQFTVSPNLDITPPKVESVVPLPSVTPYARNILVQVNFNEPVDPISASGIFKAGDATANFQNIIVNLTNNQTVSGEYRLTNQYRTVEFKTDNACGVNPCGQPIFCLPASQNLTATVKAATVDPTNPPQALITANIYDGVVDMAGNSLDGGGELKPDGNTLKLIPGANGAASGPPTDNFLWKFSTSAELRTDAPVLLEVSPAVNAAGVAKNVPVVLKFDELMSAGTFGEISLKTNKDVNVWYTPKAFNYDASGREVTAPDQVPKTTNAVLLHGDFQLETVPGAGGAIYYPFVPSMINDIYQNCFYPAVGPGSECRIGSKLNEANHSCYNGTAAPGASRCGVGEVCPYSNPPKP